MVRPEVVQFTGTRAKGGDNIGDAVRTLRSSVGRMNRLMEQLRSGVRGEQREPVLLDELLVKVTELRSKQKPAPVVERLEAGLVVKAEKERLATVFGHIIQNSQEASRTDGVVVVRLCREGERAVVEIEDEGSGMSSELVRDRLFRPFDSTKGLTGMGIGAFESRELIGSLGGELLVESSPGQGTLFRISLPCLETTSEGLPDMSANLETVQ
jgi:signal transduction histidine kinase